MEEPACLKAGWIFRQSVNGQGRPCSAITGRGRNQH